MDHTTVRYLESKRSVDARSRSRRVTETLLEALPSAPTIVEAGSGTGITAERLVHEGVTAGTYRGIDANNRLTAYARSVRPAALRYAGYDVADTDRGGRVDEFDLRFETGDALSAIEDQEVDLLVAQQFMDLVPMDEALATFCGSVRPGGLAYFPLTFDGTTVFQPDHPADAAVERAYHAAIDDAPERDSHAGRHLIDSLRARPGELLAVDAADAIVRPRDDGYHADEAFFLGAILDFVADAVDAETVPRIDDWLDTRRRQLRTGRLTYVGHRYDILHRVPH